MGDIYGFLKYKRKLPKKRSVDNRILDYKEFYIEDSEEEKKEQAGRCMDCGTPFCHSGCPLGNIIPDFNDAVYHKKWKLAYDILNETNNFPEFTGRICPAPCEASCVLGINNDPVTIEHIEKSIIEKAFENGWVEPVLPKFRTGMKVAVVGSGPAGLAAADQLNKAGHTVTVFEKNEKPGGLLRYGIPDFKLEKWVVERRIELMEKGGIRFQCNTDVGSDISATELMQTFDGILLAGGSTIPRDLNIDGRHLKGIHFAMDFLEQKNKEIDGKQFPSDNKIIASGKHVVVIGGGDTGADCVGTSNRERAASVTQIELLAEPPLERMPENPWPQWPMVLRNSSSHEEGCEREWSILTREFTGNEKNEVIALKTVEIEWGFDKEKGRYAPKEIESTEREIPCDLVLLAVGFLHPKHQGLLEDLGVEFDSRGNVRSENYQTNIPKVFTAGDMHRGQSLVVWAISEGREAAREMDEYLIGEESLLEAKDLSLLAD